MLHSIEHILRDESGSEVLEYALVLGLVFVGCILVMQAMGLKVVIRWDRIANLF